MRCLQIKQVLLTSNHPHLATIYNNLGSFFYAKGDLEQANEFYMKCLEIRKEVLPTNHPDLAIMHGKTTWLSRETKGNLLDRTVLKYSLAKNLFN
jgi:tetratricopeptide (TPR) repeat protein